MEEKKRVRMAIDVDENVAAWLDERAKANRRARCRELEMVLIEAKKRDEGEVSK